MVGVERVESTLDFKTKDTALKSCRTTMIFCTYMNLRFFLVLL